MRASSYGTILHVVYVLRAASKVLRNAAGSPLSSSLVFEDNASPLQLDVKHIRGAGPGEVALIGEDYVFLEHKNNEIIKTSMSPDSASPSLNSIKEVSVSDPKTFTFSIELIGDNKVIIKADKKCLVSDDNRLAVGSCSSQQAHLQLLDDGNSVRVHRQGTAAENPQDDKIKLEIAKAMLEEEIMSNIEKKMVKKSENDAGAGAEKPKSKKKRPASNSKSSEDESLDNDTEDSLDESLGSSDDSTPIYRQKQQAAPSIKTPYGNEPPANYAQQPGPRGNGEPTYMYVNPNNALPVPLPVQMQSPTPAPFPKSKSRKKSRAAPYGDAKPREEQENHSKMPSTNPPVQQQPILSAPITQADAIMAELSIIEAKMQKHDIMHNIDKRIEKKVKAAIEKNNKEKAARGNSEGIVKKGGGFLKGLTGKLINANPIASFVDSALPST